VDELARDERVAAAYALWQEMRDEVCRTYSQTLPERLPLSRQKEFKPVRNMVIREALKLSEMNFAFDDEGMEDEPQPEEVTVASESTKQSYTVFQQADRYRRAKKALTNKDANAVEKTAAFDSLQRLWDEGYTIAAHQLGKLYRDGIFVLPNMEEAAIWFQRSAESGNDCSAYALGKLLLEQGEIEDALRWLEQAAGQNNQYAQYRLGKVCLSGEVIPKDIDAALEHLTSAAGRGNQYAQYTLGKLFLLGQDVEQNREAAIRWLTLSAAQGNTYAQYFIDHQDDFHGASVSSAVLRMLHHMGQIFRENTTANDAYHGMQIDKKRRRKLREKKMAMGHKPDDHEEYPIRTMR
jgi:TPR repeat protein